MEISAPTGGESPEHKHPAIHLNFEPTETSVTLHKTHVCQSRLKRVKLTKTLQVLLSALVQGIPQLPEDDGKLFQLSGCSAPVLSALTSQFGWGWASQDDVTVCVVVVAHVVVDVFTVSSWAHTIKTTVLSSTWSTRLASHT